MKALSKLCVILCTLLSCSNMMQNYGSPSDEDIITPHASFSINKGSRFCYSQQVTLNTDFSGLVSVSFSENVNNFNSTLAPTSEYPWEFDYSPGVRTVYCQYHDIYGNTGVTNASITYLDRITLNSTNQFGRCVSASSDLSLIAVSALMSGIGEVYLFSRLNNEWIHTQVNLGTDISAMTGFSIALNTSGTTLFTGNPEYNANKGQLIVSTKNGSGIMTVSQIINGEPTDNNFGYAITNSYNENILAVSSIGNGISFPGLIRIFSKSGGTWVKSVDLIATPLDGDDTCEKFGESLDINSDGTVIITGDPEYCVNNSGTIIITGRAIAYRNISGTYTPMDLYQPDKTTLSVSVLSTGWRYGDSVCVNSDGSIIAVGIPRKNKGEVWIYQYDPVNTKYYRTNIIESPEGAVSADSYTFGQLTKFSQSGRLFIGANSFSVDGLGNKCGRIFYSDSAYTAVKAYTTPDAMPDDYFSFSTAISADGTSIASSSPSAEIGNQTNAGSVYIIRNLESIFK